MNIRDALDQVDALKPNQFDEQQKIYWLSQVDQRIYNDVVLRHEMDESMPETFGGYPPDVDQDTRLLAGAPFDALYRWWLEAMIDLGNGELGKYQNSMLLFNSAWNDFAKDYRRKHMPLGQQKIGFTAGGRKACGATGDAMDRLTQATQDANKAAFSAQLIAQTLQEKLASGELKGEDGSDASVTAENIQAALGYTPVKDVQVAGNSVLANGVADVPIASSTRPGVIRIGNARNSGMYVDEQDGNCYISYATNHEIDTRTAQRKTLVCANLDYAVTAAMTDGKGPAWTAAQQAAARERMGIPGDYELIEEIVLTEESRVARSKEPDGAPYNFATIMMRAEFPASDKTGNIYISYNIGNEYNSIISYFLSPYKADAVKYGYSKVWVENSRYRSGWWTCAENHGQFAQYYENPMQQDKYSIADGNIIGFSTDVMAAGTKITIYGVRA